MLKTTQGGMRILIVNCISNFELSADHLDSALEVFRWNKVPLAHNLSLFR